MGMVDKVMKAGMKVELSAFRRPGTEEKPEERKAYYSQVSDVRENGLVEVYMPIQKGKLQLLSVGNRLNMCCYAANGMYECPVVVKERFKEDGTYYILLEVTGSLIRNQRREYYRYQCVMPMEDRKLDEEERKWMLEQEMLVADDMTPVRESTIVDISGGGLRFFSKHRYEVGDLVYCRFHFGKDYRLCAQILEHTGNIPEYPGSYRHRAKFIGVDRREREEIIRQIFALERRNRKMGKA